MLTERQQQVLSRAVEGYLDDGVPVSSKALAQSFAWGPSTIRHELAELEQQGFLTQPYTSAGRVPTEAGYRHFVDGLLPAQKAASPSLSLSLSLVRQELDEAMRVTTETLSQVTDLLAVVTAPPLQTATIRHVEVLTLQPQVVMVVVITSTGGVTKRLFRFASTVDPGLADWAGSYLNERLTGTGLGARRLGQRLFDPELSVQELEFLTALSPVFTELSESAEDEVYVEGMGRLLAVGREGEVGELNALLDMLERRVDMLADLQQTLGRRDLAVRIGAENEQPALRSLALVAAAYGLPQRKLGAVSVIGPLRMNYPRVIPLVRAAAQQLSAFVSEVYDER
jgi:heat-inducible transcriptional repressor